MGLLPQGFKRASLRVNELRDERVGGRLDQIPQRTPAARFPPPRSRMMSSPKNPASPISCVTRTTVFPSRRKISRRSDCNSARIIGSSAPNGSSSRITSGSSISARIKAHAPPLSAGKLSRIAPQAVARKPRQLGQFRRALCNRLRRPPEIPRHQRDVSFRRQVREQASVLEHVSDSPPEGKAVVLRQLRAVDADGSRIGLDQPDDQPEQGGLPAAARAQKNGCFSRGEGQVEALHHRNLSKRFADALSVRALGCPSN